MLDHATDPPTRSRPSELRFAHASRRAQALSRMGSGVLLVPAAPVALRNNDVEHEYRQDSDLFYLTGFDEPESCLVVCTEGESKSVMFVRPRDPERETWDGARAGTEGAVATLDVDAAFPIAELGTKLPDLLQGHRRLYYRLGRDRGFDDRVLSAIDVVRGRAKKGAVHPVEIVDPATFLHEMRLFKDEDEIRAMERAVAITSEAHSAAMAAARPGMNECEIEAVLRAVFRKNGSERPAYSPIVGSGPNATVLHYRRNDREMQDGDLLLIDAGCEYAYQASDVTRTFPVSGTFTDDQRAVYEVVLAAQLAAIDATRPGKTLEDVHQAALEVVVRGLIELGLTEGPLEKALEDQSYKGWFMHKTSHWLGMDVHDVGAYYDAGEPRPLEPGMVLTIEPGIYVAPTSTAPERLRGIGVRIEDDVLVVPGGCRVLSDTVPKTIEDVERACRA